MNKELECSICRGVAVSRVDNFSGYKEGLIYSIYECDKCLTSFSFPSVSDPAVYEAIYKQSKVLAGYERYHYFASLVAQVPRPLSVLKTVEPSYWSVISEITKDSRKPSTINILEIGSGLGYLTYSLRKAGYKSVGIDISKEAVTRANNDFGNYYKIANLFDLEKDQERYDYVVMMDVIEHVDSPQDFLEAAAKVLSKGGKLIITTPNKSSAPVHNKLWQSDVPPVHLWFMAEDTLSYMCKEKSLTCKFYDFTEYTKKFYTPVYVDSIEQMQKNVPRLDKNGKVLDRGKVRVIPFYLVVPRFIFAYIKRRIKKKILSERTTTMCAIISNEL